MLVLRSGRQNGSSAGPERVNRIRLTRSGLFIFRKFSQTCAQFYWECLTTCVAGLGIRHMVSLIFEIEVKRGGRKAAIKSKIVAPLIGRHIKFTHIEICRIGGEVDLRQFLTLTSFRR